MPTYEYACAKCGHQFEQLQSITAEPLRKCPACGRSALKRLIGTGGGVIFKGSGFYQTDYRSDSYKKAAEAETKSATPEKADSTAKTEAPKDKPSAKPEAAPAPSSPKKAKKPAP